MGYNKYRWFTKGRPNKPLKQTAPLLLKIRNGDFDYSYMFNEAKNVRQEAVSVYDKAYKGYKGTDERNRREAATEASRMKRVKALKLDFEAHIDEIRILDKLREELEREFGVDLWDRAMELKRGIKRIEDLYWWYKKRTKEVMTKSEMAIKLKRASTRGLEHLF